MQQNNLSQPNNPVIHTNFLYSIDVENKKEGTISPNTSYQINISDSANSFFSSNLNWEYFSNELEFE